MEQNKEHCNPEEFEELDVEDKLLTLGMSICILIEEVEKVKAKQKKAEIKYFIACLVTVMTCFGLVLLNTL